MGIKMWEVEFGSCDRKVVVASSVREAIKKAEVILGRISKEYPISKVELLAEEDRLEDD